MKDKQDEEERKRQEEEDAKRKKEEDEKKKDEDEEEVCLPRRFMLFSVSRTFYNSNFKIYLLYARAVSISFIFRLIPQVPMNCQWFPTIAKICRSSHQ